MRRAIAVGCGSNPAPAVFLFGGEMASLQFKQEKFVAAYIGRANGNATEAARLAGYAGSENTLRAIGSENLTKPNIIAAIAEYRERVRQDGIAVQQNRIDEQNARWKLLKQVREERAADPFYADVPGGTTGLVLKRLKTVKHQYEKDPDDSNAKATSITVEIWEHELDIGYLKSMLDLEKGTGTELGQITSKQEITGKDGAPLVVTMVRHHAPEGES